MQIVGPVTSHDCAKTLVASNADPVLIRRHASCPRSSEVCPTHHQSRTVTSIGGAEPSFPGFCAIEGVKPTGFPELV